MVQKLDNIHVFSIKKVAWKGLHLWIWKACLAELPSKQRSLKPTISKLECGY